MNFENFYSALRTLENGIMTEEYIRCPLSQTMFLELPADAAHNLTVLQLELRNCNVQTDSFPSEILYNLERLKARVALDKGAGALEYDTKGRIAVVSEGIGVLRTVDDENLLLADMSAMGNSPAGRQRSLKP